MKMLYTKEEVIKIYDKAVKKSEELIDEMFEEANDGFGKIILKIQNLIITSLIKEKINEMVGADYE